MLGEAPTPFANRVAINSQAGRHDLAPLTFSTGRDDPSPQRQGLAPCSGATPATSTERVPPHRAPAGVKRRPVTILPKTRRVRYHRVNSESAELQI
jgi:hypothetical protein